MTSVAELLTNPVADDVLEVAVVIETVPGQMAYPVSSDFLPVTKEPKFQKSPNYGMVPSLENTRSPGSKLYYGDGYGQVSDLEVSSQPSGVLGTPPQEKSLLKLMGLEEFTPSTAGCNAVAFTGFTAGNPTPLTGIASHKLKEGDWVTVAGTSTAVDGDRKVKAVTATTVTLDFDSTGETTTSGTITLKGVRYSPVISKKTCSIWKRQGGVTLEVAVGCMLHGIQETFQKEGNLRFVLSGMCSAIFDGGIAETNANLTGTVTEIVLDAKYKVEDCFFVGMPFDLVPLAGSAGELTSLAYVKALDSANNKILVDLQSDLQGGGITLSAQVDAGSLIVPHLPTPSLVGAALSKVRCGLFISDMDALYGDGTDMIFDPLKQVESDSFEFNFSQPSGTPAGNAMNRQTYKKALYTPGIRQITGTIVAMFLPQDQEEINRIRREPRHGLGVEVGDVEGSIVRLGLCSQHFEIPEKGNNEGALNKTIRTESIRSSKGVEEEMHLWYL